MNGLIKIECAKVVKVGQFATGNGNNGPWAAMPVKVEWEYTYTQTGSLGGVQVPAQLTGKMTAVVVLRGQNAAWARDNVKAGNPYAGVPDCYLDLWVRMYGDFETVQRKDGGIWEKESNKLIADGVEMCGVAGYQMGANGGAQGAEGAGGAGNGGF